MSEANFDTIIVGAGISGLSAAAVLLQEPGHTVLILEKQLAAGGRLKTDTETFTGPDGQPFAIDLGGNWFHGGVQNNKNPLVALADEADLPYVFTDWENESTFDNGKKLSTSETDSAWELYYEILEECSKFVAKSDVSKDQSMSETLAAFYADYEPSTAEKHTFEQLLASDVIMGESAAPSALSSSTLLGDGAYLTGGDFLVRDFNKIPRMLADRMPANTILYNITVAEIDTSAEAGDATVTTSDGTTYKAKHVICTLPVGVLKRSPPPVSFVPALPDDVTQALSELAIGIYQKHFLQFPSVFWDETKHVFFNVPPSPGPYK